MSDHSFRPTPWPRSVSLRHSHESVVDDALEREQTQHLERIIASKSPEELKAIAEISPELIADWMEAFKRQEARAAEEVVAWREVMARLEPVERQPRRQGRPAHAARSDRLEKPETKRSAVG